ncbi:huntingtin-interacting protein, putative [Trichomonas vaginalis G3]|uniref:Huntingtin-interacting protein, putative n=1 Tax=Trichomonas vaginalis (strain ATCC PRA-98 / G3) TaxID=412133 RepID=A2F290_TRIV3|nr:intraciliary transport [Trichomonas vaginalis G3]EAY00969.1 huntingtin-interacting protein, putative [Trichomonas vaginalis G3]KAI5516765.1 intraciliary transport [Trichomonas vaginalis G3]|eukprot:XP_001313886.1 huntingtin-interacting protein [Trichomonas vaginalis G3]
MPKEGHKGGDEFVLMRQIYDNLQYLNYETDFDPIKRKLPYLTPIYFAVQQKSPKEQFDYFAGLCVWMMQTFNGSQIETPSDYDQPATVTDNIFNNLNGLGIKVSFQPAKLISGHGSHCCLILDALCRMSLKKKGFSPSSFRVVSGLGGKDDEVEVRGEDDEDDIVDDVVDVQEDEDKENDAIITDYGNDPQSKVIDSLELKAEAERVAPRLQIRIPAEKSDWRTHFSQMNTHQKTITDIMTQLSPILTKVGADVTQAIDAIENREKMLNNRFQTSVVDYAERAKQLETVEKKYHERVTTVNNLKTALNDVIDKLNNTKQNLDEKQKEVSDNSPLMNIKTALAKLKEDIKQLELRSAILQRSLSQAWLEEKDVQ